MKSRYILLLTVLALFTLAAPAFSQDEATLRLMHWKDNVIDGTPWWDEIINNFQAAHPGVTVETNWVTFDQYLPTLEAMIAGEELPDVFFGHVKALELGRAGIAVNFAEVFPPEYFERFYPGPLRQFTTSDGAIYALPLTAQMFGIFVNPAIMEELGLEPPETWDELIEMAPAIRDAGYVPLSWGNGGGGTCPDFFLPLIAQYGGDVWALDDLTDPNVTWDSEPVINALALLQRLAESGVFVDGINGVTETQANEIAYQGRAAMLYGGSWMPGPIALDAPLEYAETYYVAKVPALTPDGVHWSGNGSGDAWVVNNGSPNRDLGIEFVEYLLGDEAYPIYIGGSQDMPSGPAALEYVENEYVQEMASWLETDGANHILFGQGSWAAVSNVCAAILDSSMTPEDGAAQIQADVLATRGRA
jgi:raffinose/stachyose/melibiose transport system substrate-binding protein